MGTWSGRSALVTGASRGIGRAVAVALAAEGARVALVGRDRAALDETARLCRGACGAEPLVVVADVTDAAAGDAFREAIDALGSELDLLANVAGSPGSAALLKDLEDADWEAAFALHVLAPARLLRICHEALARAGGAVVNIGSIAANAAVPRSAAYSAAKAGLASLTRATAIEWARDGIRANLVEPGYVATEFNAPLVEGGFEPQLLAKVPTRRAVTPESVAQAVLFAAGNPDMTGAVLRVDGGQTARL
jgi:NAD(P)-dependent dehydrogenase (short-subunit alcohol dehydrogenase family)